MTSSLGASLRQLATSAVSACNSMTSSESAETLAHIMTSVINAHQETCVYTCDKVALGKFKYDTVMSNKPPVRLCLYTCTLVSVFTVYSVSQPVLRLPENTTTIITNTAANTIILLLLRSVVVSSSG